MGGAEGASDDVGLGWSEVEAAGFGEEVGAAFLLEVPPEIVGVEEERDVVRVFVVGLADHPRLAVVGAERVGDVKLVEAEDLCAVFGEVVAGCCAHGADAEDDDLHQSGRLRMADLLARAKLRRGCLPVSPSLPEMLLR